MKDQQKIGFGPSLIKVYSTCRNNKPSTESLESTICLYSRQHKVKAV